MLTLGQSLHWIVTELGDLQIGRLNISVSLCVTEDEENFKYHTYYSFCVDKMTMWEKHLILNTWLLTAVHHII